MGGERRGGYLDVEQHPHVFVAGLGEVLEQVAQAGEAVVRLGQRPQRREVFPLAVDDLLLRPETALQCRVLFRVPLGIRYHVLFGAVLFLPPGFYPNWGIFPSKKE